jgi:hypothetical protein
MLFVQPKHYRVIDFILHPDYNIKAADKQENIKESNEKTL